MGCARLASALERDGIKAAAIHGDKSQTERMATLEAFKTGAIDALVATDVAARGLDIADMPCVINHELPFNAEDFIHRIGRTGRAGSKGDAIALVDDSEKRLLEDIEKLMKRKLTIARLPTSERESKSGSSKPIAADPFFYMPYEPSKQDKDSSPTTTEPAQSSRPEIKNKKPILGALLGGAKK